MVDMITGKTSNTIIHVGKGLDDLNLSEEIYVEKSENNNVVIIFLNILFF